MNVPVAMVASDLDRTLIWSAASARSTVEGALTVEIYQDAPLSYVTRPAAKSLTLLLDSGLLVPVTTRTVEQYRRVRLPGKRPRYAICANGGRLLIDDIEDHEYATTVGIALTGGAPLVEIAQEFRRWCAEVPLLQGGGPPRVREAENLFCYAVFPHEVGPGLELVELEDFLRSKRWRLSVQGRKVYAVPEALSKWSALDHLQNEFNVEFVLSAGDSELDKDMLLGVGAGLVPRGSELARSGWLDPHVSLTKEFGIAAGEEIAVQLRDAVLPRSDLAL